VPAARTCGQGRPFLTPVSIKGAAFAVVTVPVACLQAFDVVDLEIRHVSHTHMQTYKSWESMHELVFCVLIRTCARLHLRVCTHSHAHMRMCNLLQKQWHVSNFANKVKVWKAEARAEKKEKERLLRLCVCVCVCVCVYVIVYVRACLLKPQCTPDHACARSIPQAHFGIDPSVVGACSSPQHLKPDTRRPQSGTHSGSRRERSSYICNNLRP
jgi:hypothetical protein